MSAPGLAEAPRDGAGFWLRGQEMTRTETFTDAAFAFAVTLLVISIDAIPQSFDQLVAALQGIPAFAMSFLLIGMFWYGHWQWSRRFGLEDLPSIVLSLALVFVVLSFVYPLKFLAGLFMVWISGRAGSGFGLSGLDELYSVFAIYGTGFVAMCLISAALNGHAYRRREALQLDARESYITRVEIGVWLLAAAIGAISVVLALLTPPHTIGLPGWVYMTLPVVMPIYGRWANRRIDSIET